MRGKGGVNVKFSAQLEITPAYAGKREQRKLLHREK